MAKKPNLVVHEFGRGPKALIDGINKIGNGKRKTKEIAGTTYMNKLEVKRAQMRGKRDSNKWGLVRQGNSYGKAAAMTSLQQGAALRTKMAVAGAKAGKPAKTSKVSASIKPKGKSDLAKVGAKIRKRNPGLSTAQVRSRGRAIIKKRSK